MHIGENCALGLQLCDPIQGFGQGEMTGMRRISQSVDDPKVEPFEKSAAFLGDGVEIGRIGDVAEAETQSVYLAMFETKRQGGDSAAGPIDRNPTRRRRGDVRSAEPDIGFLAASRKYS